MKHTSEPLDLSRKIYDNPPIEEAICEVRFKGENWDPTLPGKFHEAIKDFYPAKPAEVQHIETTASPTGVSLRELPRRTRFSTEDGKSLVHLGPSSLSVNRLRPYAGWESFKGEINRAIEACAVILGDEPVSRVGIRYTNKILIPLAEGETIPLDRFFTCHPQDLSELAEPGMPAILYGLLSKQIYGWKNGDRMTRTLADAEGPEGSIGFLLDIDVYCLSKERPGGQIGRVKDCAELNALIEDLRTKQRKAFEASITHACRELFSNT